MPAGTSLSISITMMLIKGLLYIVMRTDLVYHRNSLVFLTSSHLGM